MVTDALLTMLVVGGFFMFSSSETNTAKVRTPIEHFRHFIKLTHVSELFSQSGIV